MVYYRPVRKWIYIVPTFSPQKLDYLNSKTKNKKFDFLPEGYETRVIYVLLPKHFLLLIP